MGRCWVVRGCGGSKVVRGCGALKVVRGCGGLKVVRGCGGVKVVQITYLKENSQKMLNLIIEVILLHTKPECIRFYFHNRKVRP